MNEDKYIDRCLEEETTYENFEKYGESVNRHWAWRFYQIYPVVNATGGWANFRHWVRNHAKNHWDTCEKLQKQIEGMKNCMNCKFYNVEGDKCYDKFPDINVCLNWSK